jgi:hypothetical protein
MDSFTRVFFGSVLYAVSRPPVLLFTIALIAMVAFCWGFVVGFNYLG